MQCIASSVVCASRVAGERVRIVQQPARNARGHHFRSSSVCRDQVVRCNASHHTGRRAFTALAPAVILLQKAAEASAVGVNPEPLSDGFLRYYGKATAVSSYAGYGGTDNNENQYRYFFDIPGAGWTEAKVNKVDKSTNGTDVRFVKGAGKNASKIYLTTLAGYPKLKTDRTTIINDLALSDYDLQDAIQAADVFEVSEREKNGQLFVDYFIDAPGVTYLVTVTTDGSRIYALFGQGTVSDLDVFKRAKESFTTLNINL